MLWGTKRLLTIVGAIALASAAQAVPITAINSGPLIATYRGGEAGYKIELGVSINNAAVSTYQLSNKASEAGVTSFDFGPVVFGDTLDFVIKINDGAYFLHTEDSLNNPVHQQASVDLIASGFDIRFDDTPGGSGYVDYLFTVQNVAGAAPEAATWAMLLGGFGVLGVSMRRRRNGHITTA